MRQLAILAALAAFAACHPKSDQEEECHAIVTHLRAVTAMPMRDGDVTMLMGACMMWKRPTLDCMAATTSDADIARCRGSAS